MAMASTIKFHDVMMIPHYQQIKRETAQEAVMMATILALNPEKSMARRQPRWVIKLLHLSRAMIFPCCL